MEFLLYLILGACAGVLAGLFGVGGGIIIVPVLVFSFTVQGFDSSVLTHLAVGTSLATIVFTSIQSVRAHHRVGAVRWAVFGWMTLGILIGAGFGSLTASCIAGQFAKNHWCVRDSGRHPDGTGLQAQGWRQCAGQSWPDCGRSGDRLGIGDFRHWRWIAHGAISDLAQSDHATGGRHFVGLRLSHRSGQCHKFHDSRVARSIAAPA